MLEFQLPAIYRARSTQANGEEDQQVDDGSGLLEGRVFTASVRRLRAVPAAPPTDEDDLGFPKGSIPLDDEDVSIDELLDSEPAEERRSIDTRIARLASLLGIAAVAVVLLILMFAAGTDIASAFRPLPGS